MQLFSKLSATSKEPCSYVYSNDNLQMSYCYKRPSFAFVLRSRFLQKRVSGKYGQTLITTIRNV